MPGDPAAYCTPGRVSRITPFSPKPSHSNQWVAPPSSGPWSSPTVAVARTSRPGSWPSSARAAAATAGPSYSVRCAPAARASGATRTAPRPAVVPSAAGVWPVALRSTGGGRRPRAAADAASASYGRDGASTWRDEGGRDSLRSEARPARGGPRGVRTMAPTKLAITSVSFGQPSLVVTLSMVVLKRSHRYPHLWEIGPRGPSRRRSQGDRLGPAGGGQGEVPRRLPDTDGRHDAPHERYASLIRWDGVLDPAHRRVYHRSTRCAAVWSRAVRGTTSMLTFSVLVARVSDDHRQGRAALGGGRHRHHDPRDTLHRCG